MGEKVNHIDVLHSIVSYDSFVLESLHHSTKLAKGNKLRVRNSHGTNFLWVCFVVKALNKTLFYVSHLYADFTAGPECCPNITSKEIQ